MTTGSSVSPWVFWLISVIQTAVLGVSAWVLITLIGLMPEIRANSIRIERNEKDLDRSFRVIELLDGKVDISTQSRFTASDGKALETKLQTQLDRHEERLTTAEKTLLRIAP